MTNDTNNLGDLFDNEINNSLEQLGAIFPRSVEQFMRLNEEQESQNEILPNKLRDPYSFLGKRKFKSHLINLPENEQDYSNNLARAAREGKSISDDILKKMQEDKLKAQQKGK